MLQAVPQQSGTAYSGTNKLIPPMSATEFSMTQKTWQRNDVEARIKEAEYSFALETKGEFNPVYYVKNHPVKSLGFLLLAGIIGLSSSVVIRLQLYKKKLRMLKEEEVLLLELMKVIQRECFENNHMSMEEYEEAMAQYERKLSESITQEIETKTKLINLMKFKGKRKALDEEKKRLIEMIKKAQDDYLNKGKLETRVYENMLKSYSTRLIEVEEQIAYVDAQEALSKQGKIRKMFRV